MINKLDKFYDTFTVNERFNLTLAAWARGDFKESDKLQAYCPQKTYKMADAAYIDRLDKLKRITHRFVRNHEFITHNVSTSTTISMSLGAMTDIFDDAFDLVLDNGKSLSKISEEAYAEKNKQQNAMLEIKCRFDKASEQHIDSLRALHEGFRLFCFEVGVDYKHALDFIRQLLILGFTELELPEFTQAKANAESVEEFKNDFLKIWK